MRQDRRTAYTERVIKQAYTELILQSPNRRISVREICERADVNRGSFYLHYEDINALQAAVETDLIQSSQFILPQNDLRQDPDSHYLTGMVRNLLTFTQQHPEYAVIFFYPYADHTALKNAMAHSAERAASRWKTVGIAGEEAEYIYLFMLNGLYGLQREFMTRPTAPDADKVADVIGQLLAQGFSSFFEGKRE